MQERGVSIDISDLKLLAWLRTSYHAIGLVAEDGTSLVESIELSPDRADAFDSFAREAARDVFKVFMSRQGNLTSAEPYTYDGLIIEYSYGVEEPLLYNSSALENAVQHTTTLAIYSHIAHSWLMHIGHKEKAEFVWEKYNKYIKDIDVLLYKLHD